MTSQRLTEEEVHAACADIAAKGERPTALKLLDYLGRGSLTTISKYLNSWTKTEEAQAIDAQALPAVVQLPEELSKDGNDLLKKIWNIAKGIAVSELDVQKEALKQAEKDSLARVEEAFAFSEAQSLKIERLEASLEEMKGKLAAEENQHHQTATKLNDVEKTNVALSKDNEQLRHEIDALKATITDSEEQRKSAEQERKVLESDHTAELKKKETEIKSLDMQVHKLQTSLDSISSAHDQLKADIKGKVSELSSSKVELEKLVVRYESASNDLSLLKKELKTANKTASDAEKLVAKLEGQLEIYKTIEKKD